MAISAWFDYNGYMANKLVQIQKADSSAGWDIVKLVKAFADAGLVGAEGAEQHFEQYGQYEDVAPNAFFNATEYYRAKAAQYYGKDPKDVTDLDAAFVEVTIKDAGSSAWSHYKQYGNTEKVNPSNGFDTEAYMNAKLTALNSVKDGKQYTLPEVYDAFKAANLSALEHFMIYGGAGDAEVTQKYDPKNPVIPSEFAVPEEKKVNAGGGSGETQTLTPNLDNLVGTVGNDTFVAPIVDSKATLTAGDKIDGGAGHDELSIYGDQNLLGVTVKNVEKFAFNGMDCDDEYTVDAALYAGLETVTLQNITGGTAPTFKVTNMVDGGTLGIGGAITGFAQRGDGSNTAVSAVQGQFVDGATVGELAVDGLSTKTLVQFGGKNLNTVNITGTTTKTGVVYLDDGLTTGATAPSVADDTITTVNIDSKGGLFSLTGSKIKTVNASASTGDLTLELTKGSVAADLAVTTGSGNDKLTMDLENLSAKDAIDLGAGDKDVLNLKVSASTPSANDTVSATKTTFDGVASSHTEHALTAAAYDLINKVAGAEILEIGNNGLTGSVYTKVDASMVKNIDTFLTSMHAMITNLSNDDLIQGHSGRVLELHGKVESGEVAANTFRVEALGKMTANDSLSITAQSTTRMELFGEGNVEVKTTGSTSYNIDAKELQGFLTAGGSTAVDKITVGSGGSSVTSSQGKDVITLGAGGDVYNAFTKTLTDMDTLTGFTSGQDEIVFVGTASPAEQSSITKVEKTFTTDLATTLGTGVVSKAGVTVVTVTGGGNDAGVYAIYSTGNAFSGSDDYVVKLAGVTADQLAATDFAVGA